MTPPKADTRARGGFRAAGLAAALSLAVIVGMGLGWDALKDPGTYRGRKADYYSLLVHGFLSGHLYMDIAADPRLASPDPAVRASAPSPLDSSYYRGHFYLYFGAVPAATILLPYAWLTGADLDPRVVVVLGVMAGFLLSVGVLRLAARDHFPGAGPVFQSACVAALAFASATPLLLTRAMFYEVPIAAGYACVMAACLLVYRVLSGRGRARPQLAWAGLALGLAVGCRPDLALALPGLAAAAALSAARGRGKRPLAAEIIRSLGAAALPAALVGAGLAAYNFERFGSALDFGFSHGMNFFIGNHMQLASAAFIWPNLHWYYLTPPAISPYFPYVFPCRADFGPAGYETGEMFHGQFPVLVLAAFVGVSAAVRGRGLVPGRLAPFLWILAYLFTSVFLLFVPLGIRGDRYVVDFQPPLVLGTVILAGLVATALGRRASRAWGAAFAALVLAAAAFNVFAGIQQFDCFRFLRAQTYRRMEHVGNLPSALLQRMGLLRYGPIELKVTFPPPEASATIEPILTLGTPRFNDSVYVTEFPWGQIRIGVDHYGYGQPSTDLLPIVPGRTYTLRVEMGALYPPLDHPFFARYNPFQARRMKSEVHVEMDGVKVLDATLGSNDAPPWTLELGRNDIALAQARRTFGGTISAPTRLAPPAPAPAISTSGLWRIRCVFPLQFPGRTYPILSSGVTGSGKLVLVSMLDGNRIRFGVDEWGAGAAASDPVGVSAGDEHTVEIFIGALAQRASWPAAWHLAPGRLDASAGRLEVWLDGKRVMGHELRTPIDALADLVDIGANLQGFSTSSPTFDGPIRVAPYSEPEEREFLERNLGLGR